MDPPRNLATLAPHVEGEGRAICNIPGVGKSDGDLGILPHPSCRDHGDMDVHMQAESPLFPQHYIARRHQRGREAGEGGTSHVKWEKPDCSGLKFSLCIRSQGHGESSSFHKGSGDNRARSFSV